MNDVLESILMRHIGMNYSDRSASILSFNHLKGKWICLADVVKSPGAAGSLVKQAGSVPVYKNILVLNYIFILLAIACLVLDVVIVAVMVFKKKRKKDTFAADKKAGAADMRERARGAMPEISIGKVHNIGRRASQQDNIGYIGVDNGAFAVVADGMGGLADSDRVSQTVVQSMINYCKGLKAESLRTNIPAIISRTNSDINRMLGENGIYKSGSTVVCAYAESDKMNWVSIGDSRIYLYRAGSLLQLNREHVYETELTLQSVNGMISYRDVQANTKKRLLTSFIGMGEIKHIDYNLSPVTVLRGDRILLSTDGVFNTLTDSEIAAIIDKSPDAPAMADNLEKAVLKKRNPYQDNFSLILICYD